MGNTDLFTFDEVFTVNISTLTPFTRYYYIISAANSIGTTNTSIMNFTANETGKLIAYNFIVVCTYVYTQLLV